MDKTAYKEIFENSIYEIFLDNAKKYLKPGYATPWLSQYNSWAYITAYNPHPQVLTEKENISRNEKLLQDIKEKGFKYFPGQSYEPGSKSWLEKGYLILDMDFDTAKKLACKYGQLAFLYGERDKKTRLVFL